MPRDTTAYRADDRMADRVSYAGDHDAPDPVDGKVSDIAQAGFGGEQDKLDLMDGKKNLASFTPEEHRGIAEGLNEAFDNTDFSTREELHDTSREVADRLLSGTYRDLDRLEAQNAYIENDRTSGIAEAYQNPRFDNSLMDRLKDMGVNFRPMERPDGSTHLEFEVANRKEAEEISRAIGREVSYTSNPDSEQENNESRLGNWLRRMTGNSDDSTNYQSNNRRDSESDAGGEGHIAMFNDRDYSAERREVDIIREELARVLESDKLLNGNNADYMAQLMESAVKYSTGERTAENREADDFRLMEGLNDAGDPDRLRDVLGEKVAIEGRWDRTMETIQDATGGQDDLYRDLTEQMLEKLTDQTMNAVEQRDLEAYREALQESKILGTLVEKAASNGGGIVEADNTNYQPDDQLPELDDSKALQEWLDSLKNNLESAGFQEEQKVALNYLTYRIERLNEEIDDLAAMESVADPQKDVKLADLNELAKDLNHLAQPVER